MKRFLSRVAILVAVCCLAAGWLFFASVTEDFEGTRDLKLPPGSGFSVVLDSMDSAGVISSRLRMKAVGGLTGWYRQIKPGYYRIESGQSPVALLNRLRKGRQTPLRLTVPPGSRPGVVARVVENALEVDSASFRQALKNAPFLESTGADSTHAFGYMLPDTYQFYWGIDAEGVVSRLKSEFDTFFDDHKSAQASTLGMSTDEVVRLAAIVEWEARIEEERPRIAGVYLNRLRRGMALQADPTVQFALMLADGGRMRRLLYADLRYEHPYNTYLYPGLPPGPITNPSKSSILAVLNAEEHDYLYFVADGTGAHRFSRTLREHNNAANAYRALMQVRRLEQARTGSSE